MSEKYPYSYPEAVQNDSVPAPTNDMSIGYAPTAPTYVSPTSPAPTTTTQVSSSTVFHNSLLQTKQTLNPAGVHVLDVPYSPGHDPEEQRQYAHHQSSNGQYQRPQAPGEEILPAYPYGPTENNTIIIVQEPKKRGTWDRLTDACKSRAGGVWYCFSSLVAFVLLILLLVGCASPGTSSFATNLIKLKNTNSRYSSYYDNILYETDYTAFNPSTGRAEKPSYILFGFSGHCNVFEVGTRSSGSTLFSRQCERQFVAPFFIPPPADNGNRTTSIDGIIDISSVNLIRKIVVALFFVIMFYILGTSITVCMGYWKTIYKLWWINLILVITTVALFYFDTYSFWSPISGLGSYQFLGSVFNSEVTVLGMYLFHVALFAVLAANPIVLLIFLLLGTFGLILGFWLMWCFLIAWLGS
ncbi:hypothetical protein TWF102_001238 [Orbilia oligospora]|uniref:Uncharacterized protein n=1 Tax=Orbilia oligospora TaxID=2813651 RepID=A0A7C8NF57_ORBOL|nr:hypothetical protein TWF102_001238 [Orbilia oligospora]KAF3116227.1 hypothetical protein TWF103_009450 [Orbilia oligospora]